MKKVFLGLLAVVVLSVMVSCAPSAEDMIGEWKLTKSLGIAITGGDIWKYESPDKLSVISSSSTNVGTWAINGSKLTIAGISDGYNYEYDVSIANDVMTLKYSLLIFSIENEFTKQ